MDLARVPEWMIKVMTEKPKKTRKRRQPPAGGASTPPPGEGSGAAQHSPPLPPVPAEGSANEDDGGVVPEGGRHNFLLSVAGKLRHRGAAAEEILAVLRTENATRCVPPMSEEEVAYLASDIVERYQPDGMAGTRIILPPPPPPNGHATPTNGQAPLPGPETFSLGADALYGLPGRVVALIEPVTEADRVAILVQVLVGFGNVIGRTAHFVVEDTAHYGNEYLVLVGQTSKSRKGTSWNRVEKLLAGVDAGWAAERVKSGLSSGEGVVWACRDRIVKRERVKERGEAPRYETVEVDPGVSDKRLLSQEPEFATVLAQTQRHGNILSGHLRQAWDGRTLETLAKNSPVRATGAHVSVIGHITEEELRRNLTCTEAANGFANRFLWASVRRSKLLPDGGHLDPVAWEAVRVELGTAVAFARRQARVLRDEDAASLWRSAYGTLSGDRPGLAGAILGRAEVHTLRLSMLYALLDRSAAIREPHLKAALALWSYCEKSVYAIFGDLLGDPLADELLALLRSMPSGLTRNELTNFLGRHRESERIGQALGVLLQHGLARCERVETGGRPAERWFSSR
jgi:hypothetical protein